VAARPSPPFLTRHEEIRLRKEEEFEQQCTFKPRLNKRSLEIVKRSNSRMMSFRPALPEQKRDVGQDDAEKFSFRPHVHKVCCLNADDILVLTLWNMTDCEGYESSSSILQCRPVRAPLSSCPGESIRPEERLDRTTVSREEDKPQYLIFLLCCGLTGSPNRAGGRRKHERVRFPPSLKNS
jgi:hypothetical protein